VDWSLRACARKGHETYAPQESELRDRLHVTTQAGEAWRCLRCATFVVGPPQGSGPAEDAPTVPRGRAVRDELVLRLLAVERFLRGLILLGVAYGVLRFEHSQASLQTTFERALPAARPLAGVFNVDLTRSTLIDKLRHILDKNPHTLGVIALALFAYAALELLEGVGLFLLKRWGEYVAVVGTSIFLPLEVYELTEKFTVVRLVTFIINVAAVLYLLLTKRLFGLRGGHAAFEAQRQSASLLEVEAAAGSVSGRVPV
jgi:uncharacterized membrane protein (DUF2068 family)